MCYPKNHKIFQLERWPLLKFNFCKNVAASQLIKFQNVMNISFLANRHISVDTSVINQVFRMDSFEIKQVLVAGISRFGCKFLDTLLEDKDLVKPFHSVLMVTSWVLQLFEYDVPYLYQRH